MPATLADVTNITPASFTAKAIIQAMYNHFDSASTRFTVEASNGPSNDEGLLLSCNKAGEPWRLAFRDGGTTNIRVSIDAPGTMNDPGDTANPPSGQTDWSGTMFENIFNSSGASAGSKLWLIEMPDAIFLHLTNNTNTLGLQLGHWGRVETLIDAEEDLDIGRTGLGLHAGQPSRESSTTTSSPGFFIHVGNSLCHYETGSWQPSRIIGATYISAHTGPYDRPTPLLMAADHGASSNFDDTTGLLKYVRRRGVNRLPHTRLESPSGQAWIHVNYQAVVGFSCIPWRVGVLP